MLRAAIRAISLRHDSPPHKKGEADEIPQRVSRVGSRVGMGCYCRAESPTVSAVTKSISVTGTSSPQTGSFTPSGDGHATMIKFPGQSDA